MKIKKILKTSLILSSIISPAVLSVSCGNVKDSDELKNQKSFLNAKERKAELENIWTEKTISHLYGLDVEDNVIYKNTVNDKNSTLFKDAYKIFKLYWNAKIFEDKKYFINKEIAWKSEGIIFDGVFDLKQIGNNTPTEDEFLTLWNTEATGIKKEIENFILVSKYFAIKDKESLKKIESDFDNQIKEIDIEYFLLIKYILDKKPIQSWKGSTTSEEGSASVIQHNPKIKNLDDFNSYVKEENKDKKINLENVIELADGSIDKETITKLQGYQGLSFSGEYGLNFSKSDLLKNQKTEKFGYYSPSDGKIIKPSELTSYATGYDVKAGNNITIAFVLQIAPLTKKFKEKNEKDEEQEVDKLSFAGSKFKEKLNDLTYLFYLKDSSLINTAKEAFYKLGYLIELHDPTLKELFKDEKFIKQ